MIVVEDDASVLRALRRLISSMNFQVQTFDRPSALKPTNLPQDNACLMFDIHLPEMNGVELYKTLAEAGCRLPVILITGRLDEGTKAIASQIQPIALLFKPFGREELSDALNLAFHT